MSQEQRRYSSPCSIDAIGYFLPSYIVDHFMDNKHVLHQLLIAHSSIRRLYGSYRGFCEVQILILGPIFACVPEMSSVKAMLQASSIQLISAIGWLD
jgi:hypothetical protein